MDSDDCIIKLKFYIMNILYNEQLLTIYTLQFVTNKYVVLLQEIHQQTCTSKMAAQVDALYNGGISIRASFITLLLVNG